MKDDVIIAARPHAVGEVASVPAHELNKTAIKAAVKPCRRQTSSGFGSHLRKSPSEVTVGHQMKCQILTAGEGQNRLGCRSSGRTELSPITPRGQLIRRSLACIGEETRHGSR